MKKLFVLTAFLLLSGCGDDSLHVDLEGELSERPTVELSTSDGTVIEGFAWDYCTDIVCFNKDPIDFSALSYTPYINGDDLNFTVNFFDEVNSITLKTYNNVGEVTHRELEYTKIDANTFLLEEPFPTDESEIALNIRVNFVNEGLAHYFFPLQLQ